MGNDDQHAGKSLEEAAEEGPLPGAEEAEQAAERGEDQSRVDDPEQDADEAGEESIPGGIDMPRS